MLLDYIRIAREKAAQGGLPFHRQLGEMLYFFVVHGLGPGYYLMGRFWRPELPFATKRQHWNGKRYLRFVHRVNDPRYYKVSQNKLAEKAVLKALALPTAELIGLFHARTGRTASGHHLRDGDDLLRALQPWRGRTVFCKPAEGDSGRGVFAFRVEAAGDADRGDVRLLDPMAGTELALDQVIKRLASSAEGYVIEAALTQHPDLARFNASSVNTLRIWVADDGRSSAQVLGAFLRIGRAGSLVDNTAAGGLACAIDLERGVIVEALDLTPRRNHYELHPDSGTPLPGAAIPHWAACKALACEALRILPGARFAGMDIAVTADGPCVIEYNVEPSQQGAAHFDRPHGQLFAGFGDA